MKTVLILTMTVTAMGLGASCSTESSHGNGAGGTGGTGAIAGVGGMAGVGGVAGGAGMAGGGGTGDQAGGGGTGGVPIPHVELPACVKDLIAACPTSGTCSTPKVQNTGVPIPYCFANGVHAVSTNLATPASDGMQVSKPDGSLCYTYEQVSGTGAHTWKDAAGNVVATATVTTDSRQYVHVEVACTIGGETTVCDGGFIRSNTCCIADFGQVVSPNLESPQCKMRVNNEGEGCSGGETCL